MNSEKKVAAGRQAVLAALRTADEIYAIMSAATKMPFVICDGETYDDEVYAFYRLADAKRVAEKISGEGKAVQIAAIKKELVLAFLSNLFPMGVNCIRLNAQTGQETALQLTELVKRPEEADLPEGTKRVENPEFHLTALYYIQAMSSRNKDERSEEIQELKEEMMAHFWKGSYIVAVEEGKGMPVLKQKDGSVFQPIFTDVTEFQKFDRQKKLKTALVEAGKVPQMLSEQATGIVINPFGVNLQLKIERKKQ